MKKPDESGGFPLPMPIHHDAEFLADWPVTYEHVMTEKWDDGERREPHTLLFFGDSWMWKCMVKDRVKGRVCFLTAGTFFELLDAVEAVIKTGQADWRSDKRPPQKGRR